MMTDCPVAVRHKEERSSKQRSEADDRAGPLPESAVQVHFTSDCVSTLSQLTSQFL